MYTYLVSDCSATGEGRTISVLIEYTSTFAGDAEESIARKKKRFKHIFGDWYSIGMSELSENNFNSMYAWMIPPKIFEIIHDDESTLPNNFSWSTQLHYNFS